MIYIHRTIEDFILKNAGSFPCITLYGPRQVDKSTTADVLFGNRFKEITLDGLADRVPDVIEATVPSGYHPYKQKEKHFVGRFLRNHSIYMVGTTIIKTMYGHPVLAYGMERAICELVKERDSYDPETFLKALNRYVERKDTDSQKLYEIADVLKVSKQVREIMEIMRF
jgi:hypothetical protein